MISDGYNVIERELDREMQILAGQMRRVSFFDLDSSQENVDNVTRSKTNNDEVHFTLALIQYLYSLMG